MHDAGRRVDAPRRADADAAELVDPDAGLRRRLAHREREVVRDGRRRRRAGVCRGAPDPPPCRRAPVTTAWIFVPPRSSPPRSAVLSVSLRTTSSSGRRFARALHSAGRARLRVARTLRRAERQDDDRRLVVASSSAARAARLVGDPVRARGDPLVPRGEQHVLRGAPRVERDRPLARDDDRDHEPGAEHVLRDEDGAASASTRARAVGHDERPRLPVARRARPAGRRRGSARPRRPASGSAR